MLSLMNMKADAQAMGTAGASATIVTPVSISQVSEELNLGDMLQNIRNRSAAMLIQKLFKNEQMAMRIFMLNSSFQVALITPIASRYPNTSVWSMTNKWQPLLPVLK